MAAPDTVYKNSIVMPSCFTGNRQSADYTHAGVFALALTPRYQGTVISRRQLSRSSVSPCEQVGEHHGGAGGCLASGESGGIRAGATDGGGELASFVAQPLASSIGASSASISNRSFFMCMGSSLLLRLGALLFFCSGIPFTQHFGQAIAAVACCCSGGGACSLH
ncbi:hypothetical protein PS631_00266 [Pseudomonas fluorescens]|uniref:Uncharacterized protein n=1 Tax=Pseudomonas fluorescens TaxID=294 RepID=A0A5E6PC63_PSEFL|nr:hypothetical protein PS631_00266 [Pseudomonas fluorescens]